MSQIDAGRGEREVNKAEDLAGEAAVVAEQGVGMGSAAAGNDERFVPVPDLQVLKVVFVSG